jgi:hypothetical protein
VVIHEIFPSLARRVARRAFLNVGSVSLGLLEILRAD